MGREDGRGGTTVVCRPAAERAKSRAAHYARRFAPGPMPDTYGQLLPIGGVADRRFNVDLPGEWAKYTYGYSGAAMIAFAVAGSGVNGGAVTLPQCSLHTFSRHSYAGKLRTYELESLYAFGREIHAHSFASIIRTAIVVGLGLPYGRDGVMNGEAKVCKAYVESLLMLSGRCTEGLFNRLGKPLYSLLLELYREGGREAVREKVEAMLDWYSPRHVDNVIRVLHWYERFIWDEMNGCVDRRIQRRTA